MYLTYLKRLKYLTFSLLAKKKIKLKGQKNDRTILNTLRFTTNLHRLIFLSVTEWEC